MVRMAEMKTFALVVAICWTSVYLRAFASPSSCRSLKYKDVINELSKGNYEKLKNVEPEEAIRSLLPSCYENGFDPKDLCSRILDAQIKSMGENNLRVAESYRLLGNLDIGPISSPTRFQAKAIQIQQRLLGFSNPLSCHTLHEAAFSAANMRSFERPQSESLLWQQAIMLKTLYPGLSEMDCVRKQNEEESRILKSLPKETWIDDFVSNWKNPNYKPPRFIFEIGAIHPMTGTLITKLSIKEREEMRTILRQQLEAYKFLIGEHFPNYDCKKANTLSRYAPGFLDILKCAPVLPMPGIHSSPQEAESAINDELEPGLIEYTPYAEKNGKDTGFFLRIGDPVTGRPMKATANKALVVKGDLAEFAKYESLSRLSLKYVCGNSIVALNRLPVEVRALKGPNDGYIKATAWQSPGFSYYLPIEIEYRVDRSGIISDAVFKQMSGVDEADRAALNFVCNLRYKPISGSAKVERALDIRFGTLSSSNPMRNVAYIDWSRTGAESLTSEEKDNKNVLAFWQYQMSALEFGVPNAIRNPLTGSTKLPYASWRDDKVIAPPHKEPDFGPYLAEMQRLLFAQWDKVQGISKKSTTVAFTVKKDGGVTNLKVYKTSGAADCDKAALEAVRLADPLPPLPEHAPSQVDMTFLF